MSMEQKDEELQKKIEELALSVKEKGSSQIVNAVWKKTNFNLKTFPKTVKIYHSAAQNAPAELENATPEQKQQFIQSQIEAFNKMRGPGGMTRKDWAFWNTQPVPKFDEVRYLTNHTIFLKILFRKSRIKI